jgi:hypothetical protein
MPKEMHNGLTMGQDRTRHDFCNMEIASSSSMSNSNTSILM